MPSFTTSPQNAADLEALKRILSDCSIGATLSYADMTAALGRDPRARRWLLTKAVADVEAATGGLFETIRGDGIKRLPGAEMADVGLASIQRIGRHARRAHARLGGIRVNDMPAADRNRIIAHQSQLGAVALVADGRRTAPILREVEASGMAVPAAKTLDLFK